MVASAGLWPLSSPLAGQKRPLILPSGRFLLSGSRERPFPQPRVSSAANPDMAMSEPCPLAPVDVIGGGLAPARQPGKPRGNTPLSRLTKSGLGAPPAHRTSGEHHLEVMKAADGIIGLVSRLTTVEGLFRKGRPRPPRERTGGLPTLSFITTI
jgi:hypothetical protein